uniref:Uncharacterized protein n=1 Tax=Arundo donax TaxID=35708 RepID=A0A0A9H827_ARUDO
MLARGAGLEILGRKFGEFGLEGSGERRGA